jgi:hypothetical protein
MSGPAAKSMGRPIERPNQRESVCSGTRFAFDAALFLPAAGTNQVSSDRAVAICHGPCGGRPRPSTDRGQVPA